MPRASKPVLIWTAVSWLAMIAVDLVPAEPMLDLSPVAGQKFTYTPNVKYKPGERPGYPVVLTERYPR